MGIGTLIPQTTATSAMCLDNTKMAYNDRHRKKFYKGYKVMVDNSIKSFGVTDTKKKTIRINVRKSKRSRRKGELLDTLNHERLHADHPKRNDGAKFDKTVTRSTTRLSRGMKNKLYNLIK